jgi:O-antigen/teichoic acid export membrane protein
MSRLQSWQAFLVPKLHRIAEFLALQGVTMAGNLLYGLLCVRLLPIADYAKFVVVFGIQGTLVVLMDIGISGSLIPLVGEHIEDRQLIADYVASLRQLAHVLYAIMVPLTAIVYPLFVRNRQWNWRVVAAMVSILLVSTWFARISSAYGAVLIIRRDRGRWYRAQMISSLGTLAVLGIFWAAHRLNAFSAILINVGGIVSMAGTYFFRARHLLGVRGVASAEKRAAIVHLTLPSAPGVIFYALQGQIALLLITIFGRTAAVAGVGALGRLGQIFVLFAQANVLLIEPYFARLPRENLKSNYLGAVAVSAGFGFTLLGLSHFYPGAFLWVLGPKYAGFHFEVQQVMLSGSLGLLAGLMASINGSRRFVYYWHNLAANVLTVLMQAAFLWKADLSAVRTVLWLNVAIALSCLMLNTLCAVYGFIKGPRRIKGLDPSPLEDDEYT